MRKIKFRAWHKKCKSMCMDVTTDLLNRDYLEFMQYTGMRDDLGSEIYEGDILYFEEECEFLGYVYFEDGCFLVSGIREPLSEWNKSCRVEGNIYKDVEIYKSL